MSERKVKFKFEIIFNQQNELVSYEVSADDRPFAVIYPGGAMDIYSDDESLSLGVFKKLAALAVIWDEFERRGNWSDFEIELTV